MKIPLSEEHVVPTPHLDLGSVFRVEQHPIFWLDRSDMGSHCNNLAPGEPTPDCDCGGDQDPAATASLPWLGFGRDKHPIVQHPDRQPTLVQTAGVLTAAKVGHHSVAPPTLRDRADDQQESSYPCDGRGDGSDSTDA